jgi:undecaprenyl-diphosphatase
MAETSPMPLETRDTAAARAPHRLDRYLSLLKPLSIGLAALLLALMFIKLGGEVVEGDTRGFDTRLLLGAQALRAEHPWLAESMRDLSGLGSTIALTLFTVATVGYLALVRARTTAMLVAISVAVGSVFVSLLKSAFGRLRPDTAFSEVLVSGLSFPSGHTSMSAIVFLTLGALIASTRSRLRERAYILAAASVLTLLVGVSRVALGVHWATDVLGGWAFGVAWAMAWLLLARQVARR